MSSQWIISLVVIVVAICAALGAFGFRGRVTQVGVDLGTTFSVVGVSINGKVKIISDTNGNLIFPSVVSYQGNGEILAGYHALSKLTDDPQNTIFNSKRFIGKSLTDPTLKEYATNHPFKVVPLPHGRSNYSEVGFEISHEGEATFYISPEEVGTQILKHLMSITATFLGHNQVNKAVITVPAKFDSSQRAATAQAYKHAGLKVVRVIEEPTAAAVAYNLHKKPNVNHILVYDFGGGTLDVSLLFVSKGSVQVYATDGDDTLGGSDFDMAMYEYLKGKVEALTHETLHKFDDVGSDKNIENMCVTTSVRQMAEKIKKELSASDETQFNCKMPTSESRTVSFSVTVDDFHQVCSHLFERSLLPVIRLLNELDMSKDDIDEVVLVGGTTRIPKIKQLLRELFEKDLNDHIDPDITVAYGAACVID